jgi:hypothetical protein
MRLSSEREDARADIVVLANPPRQPHPSDPSNEASVSEDSKSVRSFIPEHGAGEQCRPP